MFFSVFCCDGLEGGGLFAGVRRGWLRQKWVAGLLLAAGGTGLAAQGTSAAPGVANVGSAVGGVVQQGSSADILAESPAPVAGSVVGNVTDTDGAAVAGARVTLEDTLTKIRRETISEARGEFSFTGVAAGRYLVLIAAKGFAAWKIKDVIVVRESEEFVVPAVTLGVEAITTTVDAISVEDLAEQQITAEEHQRILGILPNFYVSYVPNAAPLTRKQKFKLAVTVSKDPLTFLTTGVSAGIQQWQGDFAGYGQGFGGYAQRYAAGYGDHLSGTFFGAAILPSLFHQDPRYYYRGHGRVVTRALYAIATVAICKGDNGHWQPNYSNVLGNLAAGGISSLYYPRSDQHSLQVTVDNTLIGTATGAFGTLFQEFLLRHLTHGAPPVKPLP